MGEEPPNISRRDRRAKAACSAKAMRGPRGSKNITQRWHKMATNSWHMLTLWHLWFPMDSAHSASRIVSLTSAPWSIRLEQPCQRLNIVEDLVRFRQEDVSVHGQTKKVSLLTFLQTNDKCEAVCQCRCIDKTEWPSKSNHHHHHQYQSSPSDIWTIFGMIWYFMIWFHMMVPMVP